MRTIRFDHTLRQLEDALKVIESKGVSTSESRFVRHRERIARALPDIDARRIPEGFAEPEFVNAIAEANELVDVMPYLQGRDEKIAKRKLQAIVGGEAVPEMAEDEDSDTNLARNTSFEIYLADKLEAGGLLPAIGEPDLVCGIDDRDLLVACKRPFSPKSVQQCLRRAHAQVDLHLKTARAGSKGVIAVSLSRVLVPPRIVDSDGDRIVRTFPNEAYVEKILGDMLEEYYGETPPEWWRPLADGQIAALILHVGTLCVVSEGNIFAWADQLVTWPFLRREWSGYDLYVELKRALERADVMAKSALDADPHGNATLASQP